MKGAFFRHETGFPPAPKDVKALKNHDALAMLVYLYECAYLCLNMHIML